jgi:hypothetical protein
LILRIGGCLAVALLLAGCGGGGGSSGSAPPPAPTFTDPVLYSTVATASLPSAAEISAVTHHQLMLGGATLNYTATAGHLTAHGLISNAPEATFFYVAYTLDGANASTRPVTFFYNGGPGSATVWLHLVSYGPKRLATGDPATTAPTPFPLVDNAESLIDVSDLVFVDAVGTGLSEAIAPNVNQSFWGVDADAAVFRDFVIRYLAANNRGASPKFLFGESYGTTRSAVLASMLESAGVGLNGVVLQSSVLNYNVACGVIAPIVSCAGHLPSYGAVGAWYNLDNPNPAPSALPAFTAQMRALATDQYDPAVTAFLATGTPPPAALLPQLVSTTGMPLAGWQARFNMDPDFYHANLIPGTLIGLYDARVSAPIGSALAIGGDPSSTFIDASFASTITAYFEWRPAIHQSVELRAGQQCDPDLELCPRRPAAARHHSGPRRGVGAESAAAGVVAQRLPRSGDPVFPDGTRSGAAGSNAQRATALLSRRAYDIPRRRIARAGESRSGAVLPRRDGDAMRPPSPMPSR